MRMVYSISNIADSVIGPEVLLSIDKTLYLNFVTKNPLIDQCFCTCLLECYSSTTRLILDVIRDTFIIFFFPRSKKLIIFLRNIYR